MSAMKKKLRNRIALNSIFVATSCLLILSSCVSKPLLSLSDLPDEYEMFNSASRQDMGLEKGDFGFFGLEPESLIFGSIGNVNKATFDTRQNSGFSYSFCTSGINRKLTPMIID